MNYVTDKENFILRKATEEDIPSILKFIYEIAEYENMRNEVVATEESLHKSIFQNNRAEALIAELDGKEIGYVIYFYNFSTFIGRDGLYIEDIFIRKSYRGLGLGKEIFKVLGKIAREEGCKRIEWCCLNWNKPSISFYKSLGAKAMDEWTTFRLTEEYINRL